MTGSLRKKLRPYLGPTKRWIKATSYRILLQIPRGPDFYYGVTGKFCREHRITLTAKLRHLQAGVNGSTNSDDSHSSHLDFRLRRNVHRLEKGLIMQPRRPVFALDYILETTQLYARLVDTRCSTDAELTRLEQWSHDVLASYFDAVSEKDSVVREAESIYRNAQQLSEQEKSDFFPSQLQVEASLPTPDQFDALARTRKSVRWYEPKRVPREILDRAVEAAGRSPSACNRQPFRFVIFDDPEAATQVGGVPLGTAGFAQNFPCVIVVVGDIGAYFDEKDRHVIYIDAGLASMSLQLSLVSQGLGCCCINWPAIESQERRLAKLVPMSECERAVMLISVGYPASNGLIPYSAKKEVEKLRQYETPPSRGDA